MEIITINLITLLHYNLTINQYLTLLKIDQIINDVEIPFTTYQNDLDYLFENGFITQSNDAIYLTNKAQSLFPKQSINFDELFNLYPAKTPNGRILRTSSKEGITGLTKDYENNLKRYSKLAKNINIHNKILLATKTMINDHKNRNALDYLPKLETYLNQNGWEKYIGQEINENKPNIERL